MIRNKWLFIGILGLALVSATVFTTCGDDVLPVEEIKKEIVDPYAAAKPVITDQSGTKRYLSTSVNVGALSVTVAKPTDSGTITVQWYSVDTFAAEGGAEIAAAGISTATDAAGITVTSYTPSVAAGEGTIYYYVVVTNTKTHTENYDTGAQLPEPITKTATTTSAPIGVIVIASLPTTDAAITITSTENQYVRGFGGMHNAFAIGDPARYMEMRDIDTMFGPNGLGLNMLRIRLWGEGFQATVSGQVEPQMNNASTYLNSVKRVNQYGGYVLASPWMPPVHMKTNESDEGGGHLKTSMYADYANHLRSFIDSMQKAGAPVYAVSIQNEPSLAVDYNGMEWTATEHRNFLRDQGANISRSPTPITGWGGGKQQPYVKIVSGEPHQVGGWWNEAMDAVIANTIAYDNMDIGAYHIYGGNGTRSTVGRNGNLKKETWMTEYNINSQNVDLYYLDSTWDYVWSFANTIHHVIANNDSSAFVWWYLKRFYGVIGDGSYTTVNGAVMPRGYALSHYAKYATDTVRVNVITTHTAPVKLSAYQRTKAKTSTVAQQVMASEDSYSIVVYDERITAGLAATSLRVNLPAGFIATKVSGIISDSSGKRHAPLNVELNPDGDSADFTLPANAIVSVKFVK